MSTPGQAADASKPLATYLRPQDLAALLQVSVKTIYRWAEQDPSMPALRTGGLVRFHRDRVMTWLERREQGAARRRQSRNSGFQALKARRCA